MDSNHIIIYQIQGGETKIDVRLSDETVWLPADQMAELFQRNKSTISRHIKNILESGELQRDSVVAENATTTFDGRKRTVAENATVQRDRKNNSTCAFSAQVENGNIL